ncbi:MAG: heparinase II/III family protein [Victivallaceae bacterium]
MKKTVFTFLALVSFAATLAADATGILANGSWRKALRPEHPRLFLSAADLPALRERIKTVNKADFERLKKEVDALPADAPFLPDASLYKVEADGTIKPNRPGFQGAKLCKYDGGTQAAQCALAYLMTGDKVYLEKTKSYLKLHAKILDWTAKGNVWMDLLGNTRINALAAYDWIYNDLTPAERKELITPIIDYIEKSQPEGGYKFRRTLGGATDGNYGERALEFFAGVVEAGNPGADPRAEAMLERGTRLFVEMMDHREKISDGSGLLSAVTVGYTFGAYPYSSFNFIRAWKSAFGEDVSGNWVQMSDYPNWFDWSAIRITPDGKFLYYGIGDLEHKDNLMGLSDLYTHFAQSVHFYGKAYPAKAARAYALLQRFPEKSRVIRTMYPFVPFLIENFDPAEVVKADPAKTPELPYFYAPSFGLLFMRSGKADSDTFASFRFGALNGNHQHYDELSFIIYKYGFLALDSGSRTESDHHHGFAPQSVAHNTILIHQPNEELPPFWKAWSYKPDPSGKVYYNHGGQSYNTLARPVALQSNGRFIY